MAWNEPGNSNNQNPWGNGGNDKGPPDLDELLKKVKGAFGGGKKQGDGNSNGPNGPSFGIIITLIVIIILIAASVSSRTIAGFYQLDEAKQAIILRFGKYHSTKGPGLHWNIPLIDKIYVENVNKLEKYSLTSFMLTEDQNVTVVPFQIQYNIKDLKNYVLNVADPVEMLQLAAQSALRYVVGNTKIDDVITEKRAAIAEEAAEIIQGTLDNYASGILVSAINIGDATVPKEVIDALKDVNRAIADQDRFVENAREYKNKIEPEAKGQAARMLEEARGYKAEVIARATGEAERFLKQLKEYQKAKEVTRNRLYIDTIESVMSNSTKVIVDIESGNNMIYLPLDKIVNSSTNTILPNSPAASVDTNQLINEIANKVVDRLNQLPSSERRRIERRQR